MALKYLRSSIGQTLKEVGLHLDKLGCQMMYNDTYIANQNQNKPIIAINGISPQILPTNRISYLGKLAGGVELEDNVIIGPFSVLKADKNQIRIGPNSIIGSHTSLASRTTIGQILGSINLGANVTIEDRVVMRCCQIDDNVWIGHDSIVDDGVWIEKDVFVFPNSFVHAGSILESGFVYGGSPAKKLREATKEDKEYVETRVKNTRNYYEQLDQKFAFLDLKSK